MDQEQCRQTFVKSLLEFEKMSHYEGDIREAITGPIIDAMYDEDCLLSKKLDCGLEIDFYYRSKIARDFLMSADETPDHVWEPQTTKLLLHLTKSAKHVIIGGAYFGDQALLVANQIQENGGMVHAFEPNPDQLLILTHNANKNGIDNIKTSRLGLWSCSNQQMTLVGYDSFAHPQICEADEANRFSTIAIDHYCRFERIPKIDLIMLDIEGAECAALQGAVEYCSHDNAPNIIFEIHRQYVNWDKGLAQTDIIRYLHEFGYHVYAIRDYNSNCDMRGYPIELIPLDAVYLEGPPHGFNCLAIKDKQQIDHPLFTIVKNVSPKLLKHKDRRYHAPLTLPSRFTHD